MKRKAPHGKKKPVAKKAAAKKAVPKKAIPKKAARVEPIPSGYEAITPYLSVRGAAKAIDYYRKVFGAIEIMRMPGPAGTIGHAEIEINGARLMLSDEYLPLNFLSPLSRGGSPVHLHLYVNDVDATVARAVAGGAIVTKPVEDQFYGDRTGSLQDPFGHLWHVATHKEDLSEAEMRKRAKERALETKKS